MRRATAAALVVAAALSLGEVVLADDGGRAIDAVRSKATFAVQHALISRVTGDLPIVAGTIVLPADGLVPTSIQATLDPRRIKTGDDDRDSELQSEDWFDTKRFPTWDFHSTRIVADGPAKFSVEGVLTIHGVAAPVTLAVDAGGTAAKPDYHATGHVDRHAFGMRPTRIDPIVGNDVEIALHVVLKP